VLCHRLILGLAVLALATVYAEKTDAEKTGASAQTADSVNPSSLLKREFVGRTEFYEFRHCFIPQFHASPELA